MSHVTILGGGFGGLAAAHELRTHHPHLDVTLVDRRDHFYMGFAKLWDLAGTRPLADGTRSLRNLADRGVRFVEGEIDSIDPARRRVVAAGETIDADALLVGLGAAKNPAHLGLLAPPWAHDLYDAASLPSMHDALDGLTAGRLLVAILGTPFQCPPAPFEAVLAIDERLRRRGVRDGVALAIATPQPITLPVAGVDASRYVAGFLADRGIELLADHRVSAVDTDAGTVSFADGAALEVALLFGVPATAPPALLAEAGLAGPSGYVEPDPATLRTTYEGVYAVGDCTHVPNAAGALPKAGVFAAAEGVVAARNIAADLGLGEPATFDGHGFCFLELPGERVAYVEGDFFADPRPAVTLTDADHEQFLRKQAYERDRLDSWLG